MKWRVMKKSKIILITSLSVLGVAGVATGAYFLISYFTKSNKKEDSDKFIYDISLDLSSQSNPYYTGHQCTITASANSRVINILQNEEIKISDSNWKWELVQFNDVIDRTTLNNMFSNMNVSFANNNDYNNGYINSIMSFTPNEIGKYVFSCSLLISGDDINIKPTTKSIDVTEKMLNVNISGISSSSYFKVNKEYFLEADVKNSESSENNVTYQYNWSVSPSDGVSILEGQDKNRIKFSATKSGIYTFKVDILSSNGMKGVKTIDIPISVPTIQIPKNILTTNKWIILNGGISSNNNSNVKYQWVVKNNSSNIYSDVWSAKDIKFKASKPGDYEFQLNILDQWRQNIIDTVTKTISIYEMQVDDSSITNTNLYVNQNYSLSSKFVSSQTNELNSGISYQWSVSPEENITLTNSDTNNVTINASRQGTHSINLIAKDENTNQIIGNWSRKINILPDPSQYVISFSDKDSFNLGSSSTLSSSETSDTIKQLVINNIDQFVSVQDNLPGGFDYSTNIEILNLTSDDNNGILQFKLKINNATWNGGSIKKMF